MGPYRDGWKGDRPGVRLKERTEGRARSPKIKSDETRILAPGMEIMKETPWSRIRGQNSVYKEFLEIVGNGSPTGSVLEETIAVSATM